MSTRLADATTAAAQTDDHSEAELHEILERFGVHILVGNNDSLVPAHRTALVDVLLDWRDGGESR